MADLTILYLTHNQLDEEIATFCRQKLLEVANIYPIISISQAPLEFGHNVCVGPIGIKFESLLAQIIRGCQEASTSFVAVAEHDCLYTSEHFQHRPSDPVVFEYNTNHWFVYWKSPYPTREYLYSHARRYPLSQIICYRESLLNAITERLTLTNAGVTCLARGGDPGVLQLTEWKNLKDRIGVLPNTSPELLAQAEAHVQRWNHRGFATPYPNLDIQHSQNFTGAKRAKHSGCYELPYWGRFEQVIKGAK